MGDEEPELLEEEEEAGLEELQALVGRAVDEAINWRAEELDDDQAEATDYYMARPFGNEVEGRSRVVSTDVRDTVQAILPSLARIFFGPENVVEYEPVGPEDEEFARQATDMANYIIRNDNNGFLQFHGVMKDAMVRKIGVMKVWHEEINRTTGEEYTGLTEQGVMMLEAEEDTEVEVLAQYQVPALHLPTGFLDLYDVSVVRDVDEGRIKFAAIPPEEFIFSPDARSMDSAEIIGHVRNVPASELIEMGVDQDLVEKHKGTGRRPGATATDGLEASRRFDQDDRTGEVDEKDKSREDCWYGEIYLYADMTPDQNGRASLIEVQVIGDAHEIVDWRYVDERPFALWVCDPEPHTMVPLSIADLVKDIQLINSNLWRGMLDSLTLTLNPRTEVVEGMVNIPDAMNHELGGLVRTTKPGMMREVAHSFVGKEALPVLQYMNELKENRTGISKAAMGLDADALQSSTKAAVAGTLAGAQQHIEMLARIFAETGYRDLFKLLLSFMVRHQQQARTVRLRGEWVDVNPQHWNADMDVRVNLALGSGTAEDKLQLLSGVSEKQSELMQQGSPLVSNVEYRATLAKMVELAGYPTADTFFKPWGPEQEAQYQQQKQQQGPQDPALMVAQAQIEIEKQKLALDAQEAQMKDERERAKIQMDFALRQATTEAQYGAQISDQELKQDAAVAKAIIDADAKTRQAAQAAQAAGGMNGGNNGGAGPGGGPAPRV
jgi:hypothetical protein